jgi:2-polyprenyl-3-methyl-5-hydroxy-6-metoxy-1,4-benzoquinol methylase
MQTQKKNVSEFNQDVKANEGYKYTTNAPFSSIVANKRITDATIKYIPKQSKTIIDIGCGDGIYTNDLKRELQDLEFTGFDPASDAINIANKKYQNINFIVGDLLNEETFPKEKYDVGIIRGVLHHLPNAQQGISKSIQLSDTIIIIEPNGNNPILKYIEKTSQYHIDHEEQSFKSDDLIDWCEKSGFKVSKMEFIGFVPFFFPSLLAKVIYFFQPILEKIPLLGKYFGAQIIMFCQKK